MTISLEDFRRQPDSLVFNRGLERETLRVDGTGSLALTSHPEFLGSKLSHPLITTDFSESQLELITPVVRSVDAALTQLSDIHRFIYSGLQNELLWPASMPCHLPPDERIPLAQYGTSNLGLSKTAYRSGLGQRYGRTMQTICAIHYNFSFPDSFWHQLSRLEERTDGRAYRSERYFDLMRNFRRLSWLPTYLFGASPAVSESFLSGRDHALLRRDQDTFYLPNATSLRNGGLGYQSDTQSGLINICYNSLENYVQSLAEAICTEHEPYRRMSESTDDYIQLGNGILQSEAEFYTTIRAKRVHRGAPNLLAALHDEGVEYIEVRLLDIDPYSPLGIDATTMEFMDCLLLHCLFESSPDHDESLCASVAANLHSVVTEGRADDVSLDDRGSRRSLTEWGTAVIEQLGPIAKILDQDSNSSNKQRHQKMLNLQLAKLKDADLTPSARMLRELGDDSPHNGSFHSYALELAKAHRHELTADPVSDEMLARFGELTAASLNDQRRTEESDTIGFADYLAKLRSEYQQFLSSVV